MGTVLLSEHHKVHSSVDRSFAPPDRLKPMVAVSVELACNSLPVVPVEDRTSHLQASEIDSASEYGESRVNHGPASVRVSQTPDDQPSQRGAILGSNGSTEGVESLGILKGEGIGAVKDRLRLSVDLTVE